MTRSERLEEIRKRVARANEEMRAMGFNSPFVSPLADTEWLLEGVGRFEASRERLRRMANDFLADRHTARKILLAEINQEGADW